MRTHLVVLAVLHAVQALFALAGALVVLLSLGVAGFAVGFAEGVPTWLGALLGTTGVLVGVFLLALALPGLALAWGLYTRRSWARPLGLVLGVLSLVNFPLGTILGVYTLWALLQPETAALLGRRADAAYH